MISEIFLVLKSWKKEIKDRISERREMVQYTLFCRDQVFNTTLSLPLLSFP